MLEVLAAAAKNTPVESLDVSRLLNGIVGARHNDQAECDKFFDREARIQRRFEAFTSQREMTANQRYRAGYGSAEWIVRLYASIGLADTESQLRIVPFTNLRVCGRWEEVITRDSHDKFVSSTSKKIEGVEEFVLREYGFIVTPRTDNEVLQSPQIAKPWGHDRDPAIAELSRVASSAPSNEYYAHSAVTLGDRQRQQNFWQFTKEVVALTVQQ